MGKTFRRNDRFKKARKDKNFKQSKKFKELKTGPVPFKPNKISEPDNNNDGYNYEYIDNP
jgi:hypothetical protein